MQPIFDKVLLSIPQHPVRWGVGFLTTLFVGDLIGRGLLEKGGGAVMVVSDWWAGVRWVFDHPIGELILLCLAGYCVWSAVAKTVRDETKKQQEKRRIHNDALADHNRRLDALFGHLIHERMRRELIRGLTELEDHRKMSESAVERLIRQDLKSDHPSGWQGELTPVFCNLYTLTKNLSRSIGQEIGVRENEISSQHAKETQLPLISEIENETLAEMYRKHMFHIRATHHKIGDKLEKLENDARLNFAVMFPGQENV